jgi:predicted secreted protein
MNRQVARLVLAGAIAVGTLAPGFARAHDLPDLTPESNTIAVAKGSTFRIVLAANPSTGFNWSLKGFSRPGVAQVLGCTFIASTSHLPGAGGTSICRVEATGVGTTTLTLRHARSWTSEGARIQQFIITVTP